MKKIKVCYVISSLSNQGPPNVLYNIVKYMDFSRFDVFIITMVEEQKISRIEDFKALPIKVIQMSPYKTLLPLAMYRTLKKNVELIDPDILHTHCPRSMFLVPFLPKKYKKMETVHIYPGIQQKVMYGNIKGQVVIWLSHFFTKKMDLPIACSESVAQSYWDNQHFKMKAIPNGCSLPLWREDVHQKATLRKNIGLKEDVEYFIFIGRFSYEKHPELIIKAFEQMDNSHLGVVLLGEGDLYNDLKLHETDRIILPGFKSNVYDYLIACDYYISASDVEGLANTLLESMTVGLPCVLSDIPSHKEVMAKTIQPMGYNFDNKNINSLIEAIKKVLALDVKSTSHSIRKIFERYYTAKHMSELYQKAVSYTHLTLPTT